MQAVGSTKINIKIWSWIQLGSIICNVNHKICETRDITNDHKNFVNWYGAFCWKFKGYSHLSNNSTDGIIVPHSLKRTNMNNS